MGVIEQFEEPTLDIRDYRISDLVRICIHGQNLIGYVGKIEGSKLVVRDINSFFSKKGTLIKPSAGILERLYRDQALDWINRKIEEFEFKSTRSGLTGVLYKSKEDLWREFRQGLLEYRWSSDAAEIMRKGVGRSDVVIIQGIYDGEIDASDNSLFGLQIPGRLDIRETYKYLMTEFPNGIGDYIPPSILQDEPDGSKLNGSFRKYAIHQLQESVACLIRDDLVTLESR